MVTTGCPQKEIWAGEEVSYSTPVVYIIKRHGGSEVVLS